MYEVLDKVSSTKGSDERIFLVLCKTTYSLNSLLSYSPDQESDAGPYRELYATYERDINEVMEIHILEKK